MTGDPTPAGTTLLVSPDESALLSALRSGSATAYRDAVRRYGPAMLSVARAIVGEADCEDAVQDAWISAVGAIATFEGRSSFKTWLISITVNKARNRLRTRRAGQDEDAGRAPPFDGRFLPDGHWREPPAQWHEQTPDALLQAEALWDCVDRHLGRLPEAQRLVLTMRDMEGLEQEAIASTLALSLPNVRVMLHRARLRLMEMVDHYQDTGEC
jgi:RNA polymerase sigma-70 factor (ECF subfamily)